VRQLNCRTSKKGWQCNYHPNVCDSRTLHELEPEKRRPPRVECRPVAAALFIDRLWQHNTPCVAKRYEWNRSRGVGPWPDRAAPVSHKILVNSMLGTLSRVLRAIGARNALGECRASRGLAQDRVWPVGPLTRLDRTVTLPLLPGRPLRTVARHRPPFLCAGRGPISGKRPVVSARSLESRGLRPLGCLTTLICLTVPIPSRGWFQGIVWGRGKELPA
jgi:hypothetical protein